MKSPNHNEAGMLAFALAQATIEVLTAKGVLSSSDELAILIAARDSFEHVHTANAATCAARLVEAIGAHPLAKEV